MPTVALPPEQSAPEITPLYYAAVEDRLRSLTTLAGGLAHSLRSPLTAIMGQAELIGVRQPTLRQQMHGIVSECERVNSILQAVTATLSLEAATAPRPVNLTDLVERECELMRLDRHFKHEIETEFALASELPSVTALYGAIAGAFAALVGNAVIAMRRAATRYLVISTESSGETVASEGGAVASEGGAVALTVRDSGCGIAPEHLPRVFEPGFTTFDGEHYGPKPVEHSGRGYGLSYAAAVVHDYGGTISVSSEPAAGTTVTLTLPVG
jgi:two-component system sensor histidine kinase HydH